MRETRMSGLMSGDGKRSDAIWPKPPRPSSTLPIAKSACRHAACTVPSGAPQSPSPKTLPFSHVSRYGFFGLAWPKWAFTGTVFPDAFLQKLERTEVGLPSFGFGGFFITLFRCHGRTRAGSLALFDLPIFV